MECVPVAVERGALVPDDGSELLSLAEAADLCTVDYETFRRWVAKGTIRHVLVGPYATKRVRRRDVEALIRGADDCP